MPSGYEDLYTKPGVKPHSPKLSRSHKNLLPPAATGQGGYADLIAKHGSSRNPLQQVQHFFGENLAQSGRDIRDVGQYISQNPFANGLSAVLGTTERAGVSGTSAAIDAAQGKGSPLNVPVSAVGGVLNPEGDLDATHKLEGQEFGPLLRAINPHLPKRAQVSLPNGQGLSGAGLDFIEQTLHDPATYLPVLDLFSIGGRVARAAAGTRAAAGLARGAGRVGQNIARHIPETVKAPVARASDFVGKKARDLHQSAREGFTTSHTPLQGLTQPGLNETRAAEGGARHLQAAREDEYLSHGIAPMRSDIDSLEASLRNQPITSKQARRLIPKKDPATGKPLTPAQQADVYKLLLTTKRDLNARDLRDPNVALALPLKDRLTLYRFNKITDKALWRDASSSVRRAMLKRGYKPSADEINLPVTNLVHEDFGRRYLPEQELYSDADKKADTSARGGVTVYKGGPKRSGADKRKGIGVQPTDPLYDRLENRLASSAYLEPKRRSEQQLLQTLGFKPTNTARTQERVTSLQDAGDELTRQQIAERTRVGPFQTEHKLAGVKAKQSRYQTLLEKQQAQDAENIARQERYTIPTAPRAKENVREVIGDKGVSAERAARDLRFFGRDVSDAFGPGRRLKHSEKNGVVSERSKNATLAANQAYRNLQNARTVARETGERIDKSSARISGAVDKHEKQQYNRLANSDVNLRTRLKKLDDATEEIRSGYPRSGQGILGNFQTETQHVLNRKGQRVASALDPLFKNRVSTTLTNEIDRLRNIKRPASRAEARASSLLHNTADRAVTAVEKKKKLDAMNAQIEAIQRRVDADPSVKGNLDLPNALYQRLYGAKVKQEPGILRNIAKGASQVLFSNFLPHLVGNISQQQVFAGGGARTLLGGLGESVRIARKDPQALARLNAAKSVGATYEHGFEDPAATSPFARFLNTGQRVLTAGHEGQVSALFDKYKKSGMSDADAAEEVRKTFGRVNEVPREVQKMKDAGVPFAEFGLSTVPRSSKKALGSAKGRNNLKLFSRAVSDVNQDILEPEYGVDLHPGGFSDRLSSVLFQPLKYLGGRSLDSSLNSDASDIQKYPTDALRAAIPLYGTASGLLQQPLSDKQRRKGGYKDLPLSIRAATAAGAYFTHAETHREKLLRQLRREGLL